jgi:hypothetical protein
MLGVSLVRQLDHFVEYSQPQPHLRRTPQLIFGSIDEVTEVLDATLVCILFYS